MLGMYLKPDGNNEDKLKYIHKKATSWANSIISGSVQQNKSWKDLNSTIPQTMKYRLPAMVLNEEECKHIMRHIVTFGLTKDGISITLHTTVIYGPWYLEGIGTFDPFLIQVAG